MLNAVDNVRRGCVIFQYDIEIGYTETDTLTYISDSKDFCFD